MGEEETPFPELLRRVRAGDQDAAVELVSRYESAIRRAIRIKLMDSQLRGALESMDICQSVMGSFFVRAAAGQFDLEHPDQLLRLLVVMTRHKLAHQTRRHRAKRRDCRRLTACDPANLDGRSAAPSPSRLVVGRELLAEVNRLLSQEERLLAELRGDGYEWTEIAARLGGTAEARRKQLARAVDRLERELNRRELGDD
jgi:RNA polymerase sigma factor (sigma-70 family)